MLKSFTKDINKKPNAIGLIILLWGNLKRKRKKQFYLVLFLMVVSGVLEVLSVISLLPLLAVLSDSESISNYRILFYLVNVFDVQSDKNLLTFVIILFFTVVTLSGTMRLFSLYVNTLFAANVGHELSMDLFEKTMYQSYETHINRNSSVVVAAGSIHMVQTVQSFYNFASNYNSIYQHTFDNYIARNLILESGNYFYINIYNVLSANSFIYEEKNPRK